MTKLEYGKAICYSGYREGPHPDGIIPNAEQIREDLTILIADGYRYLRMYEPNEYARNVLKQIHEDRLPLQCIIGIDNRPEISNPDCPWDKQDIPEEELAANAKRNDAEAEKLIRLVKEFPDEIVAVAVGNENTPSWGARLVPANRLLQHIERFHEALDKPVTYCEGVLEWADIPEIAGAVDFISIHCYPLHYGNTIDEAFEVTRTQYEEIKEKFPDKQIIFTELGWSTKARDDLKKNNASEENQKRYVDEITTWFEENEIIGFLFEAFDEPWKGEDEYSCERNWGFYYVDRTPKPVARSAPRQ